MGNGLFLIPNPDGAGKVGIEEAFKKYPALAEFFSKFPSKYALRGGKDEGKELEEVITKEEVLAYFSSPKELRTRQFKVRLLPYAGKTEGYGFSLPLKDFREILAQYPSDTFKGEELLYAIETALMHLLEKEYGNVPALYDKFGIKSVRVVKKRAPRKVREEKKKSVIDQLLEQVKEVLDETEFSPEP